METATRTRARIGNKRDAQKAYNIHVKRYKGQPYNGNDSAIPAGWKDVGSGCYRTAYLNESTGVVYKVGNAECNENDAINSLKFAAILAGVGVSVPKAHCFTVKTDPAFDGWTASDKVASMEFIHRSDEDRNCDIYYGRDYRGTGCTCGEPDGRCVDEVRMAIKNATNNVLSDLHYENLVTSIDGRYVLIDMG